MYTKKITIFCPQFYTEFEGQNELLCSLSVLNSGKKVGACSYKIVLGNYRGYDVSSK